MKRKTIIVSGTHEEVAHEISEAVKEVLRVKVVNYIPELVITIENQNEEYNWKSHTSHQDRY